MLERVPLDGQTVTADKGFAGAEFEGWTADRGATFLCPIEGARGPLRLAGAGTAVDSSWCARPDVSLPVAILNSEPRPKRTERCARPPPRRPHLTSRQASSLL